MTDWLKRGDVTGGLLSGVLSDDAHLRRLEERAQTVEGERARVEEEERMAKQDRPIITPAKWIESEYFAGSLARTMYPKLKEHFVRIVGSNYHRVLLAGATRYGKSYLARALMGRSTYELEQKASPQHTFHIQDESNILLLTMNVTDKKAKDSFFTSFGTWVRSTPYFRHECPPQPRVINQLRFPKHVIVNYAGAQPSAAESEDLHFFVGDECNLYEMVEKSQRSRTGTEEYDAAKLIKTEVQNRMVGTYRRADGAYPSSCKQVWLCKETYPGSFLRAEIAQAQRSGAIERGETYVLESTEWGMKPRRCRQCEAIVDEEAYECGNCGARVEPVTYFWVRTASRTESARIIEREDEARAERGKAKRLERSGAPMDEQFRVVPVPVIYKPEALDNLEKFQRDMIGIATEAISVFFKQREPVFAAHRRSGDPDPLREKETVPAEACVHPFSAEATTFEDGVRLVRENLAQQVKTGNVDENGNPEYVWRPIMHPESPRYAGIDAGLTGDACGIAVGHQAGWKKVVRFGVDDDRRESRAVEAWAPWVWYDLLLEVRPPPSGQIPYAAIRGLLYSLMRLGVRFAKITCDSFQHVALTQPFEERGFNVEVVSVDRTPDAYNMLHAAYHEHRVSAYPYAPYEEALVALERVVTGQVSGGRPVEKIDHPPGGKKDVSDAAAQVCAQIEKAAAAVGRSEALPTQVEPKRAKPLVEVHEQAHKFESAFERGDFERMEEIDRMMREREEEDW